MNINDFTILIPAKNEASNLDELLPKIKSLYQDAQIIVVDDGSTDNTIEICQKYQIEIVSNPYSKGNGAAIKQGIQHVRNELVVMMDADGQHDPKDIPKLLAGINFGYDLVVGARNKRGQASFFRWIANGFYNWLASKIVGHQILDLTSGFRAVKTQLCLPFIGLLPNGFSYPTTMTMIFYRLAYSVFFTPIEVKKRKGKSHISLIKDGLRFLVIIFKIGTLYSPLKIFSFISLSFFIFGSCYYLTTYALYERFTNMGILIFIMSILFFTMGLVSEQINLIMYRFVEYQRDDFKTVSGNKQKNQKH